MSSTNYSKPIIYSICIPRVFKNITEKRVRAIFYSLKCGFIERVDMITKHNQNGDEFSRVFVHFSSWNTGNKYARALQEKLNTGQQVKIVYDNPWYWMVSKSNAQLPEERRTNNRPKPFIDFNHEAPEPTRPVIPTSPANNPTSPANNPTSPIYNPSSPTSWPSLNANGDEPNANGDEPNAKTDLLNTYPHER